MVRHERQLLALILAGMGTLATATPSADAPAPGAVSLGGTLHLGGLVLAATACGDKEDEDTGSAGDGGGSSDGGSGDGGEGRPFTVAETARTAPAAVRTDWADDAELDPSSLTTEQRRHLARHYLRMAAAEHASVASFQRFALELLHLGAPPALLLETQQATSDEVRHAQAAYGIASRLSGQHHGPGPLDVRGALDLDLSPRGILQRLVDEACVGETISALWVREAALRARDPVLQAELAAIAEDEERHAALGWKSLAWLVRAHPELRRQARQLFQAAFERAWSPGADPGLEPWGLLRAATRAELRERAFLQVILPAAAALG